ncbi:MAG: sel1 repeat family protein [Clostridiales bacterium]|nr:sel1 repeat family protein [Clostridiales bacterium]
MKKLSLILALLLMLSCLPFACAETQEADVSAYDAAFALYQAGDYAAALPLFEELGNAGNASAMYYTAVILSDGLTGDPDHLAAAEWFNRAVAAGDHFSAINLIYLYRSKLIPSDAVDTVAVRDLLLSMESTFTGEDQNDGAFLSWIAAGYECGMFSPDGSPDYTNALAFNLRSAGLGHFQAMFDLGKGYMDGSYTGGIPDPEEAVAWYQKAYEGGEDYAFTLLYNTYHDGVIAADGTDLLLPDEDRLIELLNQAFDKGTLTASHRNELVDAILAGDAPDYQRVLAIWLDGARKGEAYACTKTAYLYKDGATAADGTVLIEKDMAMAFIYFEKAHAMDPTDVAALEWLGWFLSGNWEPIIADYPRAREIYDAAAELGSSYAMLQLGTLYRDARLGEADYDLARQWFEAALNAGREDAQAALDALNGQ